MRRFMKASTFVLTVALMIFSTAVATENPKAVQEDIRQVSAAAYSGDIDTVLSFTHPKIIELMGGETKAKSMLSMGLAMVKSMGMELVSQNFPEEPTFVSGEINEYVIVPTLNVLSINGQQIQSMGFQFGIRTRGEEKWTYMDGSRVTDEILADFFPDFPLDYSFPPVSKEAI